MIAIIAALALAVFLLDVALVFYNWRLDGNRTPGSLDDVIGMDDRPPPRRRPPH